MTKIPWTNKTWNPVVGCTKIAAGCKNCYAEKMACRLAHMGVRGYRDVVKQPEKKEWLGVPLCLDYVLDKPRHWRKPRKIFVCSMGDLFHEKVPFEFIDKVFSVMVNCNQHIYQILTKRPKRMAEYIEQANWSDGYDTSHIWRGTSISTQADADKNIPILQQIPAAVRYVSLEPILEKIQFNKYPKIDNAQATAFSHYGPPDWYKPLIRGLDWVIIGCESGPKARLCDIDDIRNARNQATEAGVPVFVKQIPLPGCRKCRFEPCTHLHGHKQINIVSKNPKEWPEDLRIQEYPCAT